MPPTRRGRVLAGPHAPRGARATRRWAPWGTSSSSSRGWDRPRCRDNPSSNVSRGAGARPFRQRGTTVLVDAPGRGDARHRGGDRRGDRMRPVPIGAEADLDVVVTPEMTVRFDELGPVHPVYATYSMAKHFEEAGRKLLLRHLEEGEAGIGRSVSVEHLAPSWVGDTIRVTARCTELQGNRLTCECRAVDTRGRVLGRGTTVQFLLPGAVLDERIGEEARRRADVHGTEDAAPGPG